MTQPTRTRTRTPILCLAALFLPAWLAAQGGEARVDVSARFEPAQAPPGAKVSLIIDGTVHPGYHLYGTRQGGEPSLAHAAATSKQLTPVGGFQVPEGELHIDPAFPDEQHYWIEGKTSFKQTFQVVAGLAPGKVQWNGSLTYMACTPQMCDPEFVQPVSATLEVVAEVGSKATAGARPADAKQAGAKQKSAPPSRHVGNHQTMDLEVTPNPARAGEVVTVEIRTEVEPGWHHYGTKQDREVGLPVSFEPEPGVLQPIGEPEIPAGELHVTGGMEMHELTGTYKMSQQFKVPADAAPGELIVAIKVSYSACDESMCDPIVKTVLGGVLRVEAGAPRTGVGEAGTPPGKAGGGTATSGDQAGAGTQPPIGDGEEPIAEMSLLNYLLLAVGAGLFALIMPCTYPMIPITISFFTKQAEQRGGSALPLALLYGFGIIASFVVVGGIVALSGFDMLKFATNGWVNLALCALFVFFALSLFGIVELRPPAFMMNTASKASTVGGPLGVFLMGGTLCISSFACTAPFLGTMLAAGAGTGSKFLMLVGMAVFGLTMALPFVILSLVPGKLPRSGGWMNTAKVIFGFVELAAALKFFSITDVSWNLESLPRELFLMIWAALFAVCGIYTLGFIKLKGESGEIGGGRLVTGVATIVFAFYCAHGAMGYRLGNEIMIAFEPPYRAVNLDGGGEGKPRSLARHEIVKDDFDSAVVIARRKEKLLLVNLTGYN